MKESKNPLTLYLMGGLGNQIFQVTFLRFAKLHSGKEVRIQQTSSSIRRNGQGEPDIFSYDLGEEIKISEESFPTNFFDRTVGFALRMKLSKSNQMHHQFLRITSQILVSMTASVYYKKLTNVFIADDIGFVEWKPVRKHQLIVGYFQSYKYLSDPKIYSMMRKISLKITNNLVENYSKEASRENPLLVHVRLGDYRNEPNFGVLSNKYYESCIESQMASGKYKKIWVFSDDTFEYDEFLPIKYRSLIRFVDTNGMDSATLLEVMRLCSGYVIANSTLSWWAASISQKESLVTYPQPWFSNKPNPSLLANPNWIPIPRG